LGLKPVPYTLSGFHVSSLPAPPVPTPTAELAELSLLPPEAIKPTEPTRTPSIEEVASPDAAAFATIAPSTTDSPSSELVLFVGPPAIGKTTHYTRHFAPRGYVHINQDTLGTRAKCITAARTALAAGTSAVIDNTNRDAGTRAEYTKLAREAGAGVRCVLFEGGVELARHNNLYRAYIAPAPEGEKRRAALPEMAIAAFRTAYVEPRVEEGFVSVERVPFVFEGGEEERAQWGMWLSVDK
jgi:bifunctional polynucleotide phosphatase/kinase